MNRDNTYSISASQYKKYRECAAVKSYVSLMMKPNKRLMHEREQAGYETAGAFANAKNITESTYRSHENGHRPLSIRAAKQYANIFGIPYQDLIDDVPATGKPVRSEKTYTIDTDLMERCSQVVAIAGTNRNLTLAEAMALTVQLYNHILEYRKKDHNLEPSEAIAVLLMDRLIA